MIKVSGPEGSVSVAVKGTAYTEMVIEATKPMRIFGRAGGQVFAFKVAAGSHTITLPEPVQTEQKIVKWPDTTKETLVTDVIGQFALGAGS